MQQIFTGSVPIDPKYAGVITIRDESTGAPTNVWQCDHEHHDSGEVPGYIVAAHCADAKLEEIVKALAKGGLNSAYGSMAQAKGGNAP